MGMDMLIPQRPMEIIGYRGTCYSERYLPSSAAGKVLQPEDRQILDRIRRLEEGKMDWNEIGAVWNGCSKKEINVTQSDTDFAQKAALFEESTNKVEA